jgi:phosphoribosylglycinamide formyltransferase-1
VGATEPSRLAVLLSGRGSNFLALHAAIERGEVPAALVLVISNVEEAPGLARARGLGVPSLALPSRAEPSREAHEEKVLAALDAAGAEWICLAGYMRLLSPVLVRCHHRRIVNVHPSLLPAFPGLEAQRQALQHGVRVTGCTVHLVDDGLDSGPIVDQRPVPVLPGDSVESLAARILVEEHRAYPAAMRRLLTERWEVTGRRLLFSGGPEEGPPAGG